MTCEFSFSTDVNDNAPEFVRKLHEITVEENTPLGTEVLRVMATSRDIGINAEISYSLQHTTQEKYLHIHPKTGIGLFQCCYWPFLLSKILSV